MSVRAEPLVIGIIGAGEMGAAVRRRLRAAGARVLTSLSGSAPQVIVSNVPGWKSCMTING
jgi:phosphoglycerate dehydrogenase-like enzyme